MEIEQPSRRMARIGLTPLIDVVFILLLFFMLASSLDRWQGLTVSSATRGGSAGADRGAVLLRVAADGQLDLNGRALTLAGLPAVLTDFLACNPDQAVILRAAPELSVQQMVNVYDVLVSAGVRRLTLDGD